MDTLEFEINKIIVVKFPLIMLLYINQ